MGVAVFVGWEESGWYCIDAMEMEPIEFEDWLTGEVQVGAVDYLVVEQFVLFGDKAQEQTGSDMPTSQLIGAIRYIHRTLQHSNRWPGKPVLLDFHPPAIKNPTRSLLRNRGVVSVAKARGIVADHAADAELHGWHHILRTLGGEIDRKALSNGQSAG